MPLPPNIQSLRRLLDQLYGDSFRGWDADDMPHVDCDDFDSIDNALAELSRRMQKNGRLKEYQDRQHYTKPSERRREQREAQAHRARTGREKQWRGGVYD